MGQVQPLPIPLQVVIKVRDSSSPSGWPISLRRASDGPGVEFSVGTRALCRSDLQMSGDWKREGHWLYTDRDIADWIRNHQLTHEGKVPIFL